MLTYYPKLFRRWNKVEGLFSLKLTMVQGRMRRYLYISLCVLGNHSFRVQISRLLIKQYVLNFKTRNESLSKTFFSGIQSNYSEIIHFRSTSTHFKYSIMIYFQIHSLIRLLIIKILF